MSDGTRAHPARGFRRAAFCTTPGRSSSACSPHIFIVRAQGPSTSLLCATGSGAEPNGQLSRSSSLRHKHAPVIRPFVPLLICRLFSRFSLPKPCAISAANTRIVLGSDLLGCWLLTRGFAGYRINTFQNVKRQLKKKTPFFFFS